MIEKSPFNFFIRLGIPTLTQLRAASRQFSKNERRIFLAALILLTCGVIGLLISINSKYSVTRPAHGGKWREGIVGSPSLINPLLAVSDADRDLTALVYSGLMRPDGQGGLNPDLAENYEISEDGLTYTFRLKENLRWHDGKKLDAEDVIFTIEAVKNPSLKSPIRANWEGIAAEAVDELTIKFTLTKPYAPFLENTTFGVLPKHIWSSILPEQFTLSSFNYEPVGSGPYKIKTASKNSSGIITKYALAAFEKYAGGMPFIKTVEMKLYSTERALSDAYANGEIDALAVASPKNIADFQKKSSQIRALNLPRIFAVFFNQNRAPIFAEKSVRVALNQAADKKRIIDEVFGGFAEEIDSPIPPGFLDAEDDENTMKTSGTETASSTLKSAGWTIDPSTGFFVKKSKKDTKELAFTLATANTPDLAATAELLKTMWQSLGAEVDIKLFEISDLNQQVIRPREYDALLFGEVAGRDPDPFAFWHSSQRNDPGLNIALYANSTVDRLLESARKTVDDKERKEKYLEFHKEILKDIPAIFLYSPSYLYAVPNSLKGFETENITIPSERFARIHLWHLKTKKVLKFLAGELGW